MGNIFKTLGLDDLVRTIPGIGGAAADFLGSVNTGQKSGPGSGLGLPFGKTEGRMSNEDYQFNQDLLDSSNPREIKRTNEFNTGVNETNIKNQGDFLKGIAPAQATGYNVYQDATQPQDTQRQIDRIKTTGEQLGMSPWEVTGAPGSAPLPSPSAPQQNPQQRNNNGAEFLSTMTPLAVAKMNNKTALQTAKMQNDTQLKIATQNNETTKFTSNQSTNSGELPKQQQAESAARTVLNQFQQSKTSAETGLINTQSAAAENKMWLDSVATMIAALPTIQTDFGVFKSSEKDGYRNILKMLGTTDVNSLSAALQKTVRSMPKPQFDQLTQDTIKLAGMFTSGAKGALNAASSLEGLMLTIKNMLK